MIYVGLFVILGVIALSVLGRTYGDWVKPRKEPPPEEGFKLAA